MGPGYGRRSAKSAPLPRVVGDDREAFCRLVLIESAESGFRVVATRLPIAGRDWKTPFSTPDGDRRARASVRADERSDPRRARTVILTRQFRYPAYANGYDDLMIEACAGLLDEAAPDARIRAEVEEETGYRLGSIEKIFECFMSPGAVTERLYFFVAEYRSDMRVGDGGGLHDEGEDIGVLELPFDVAMAMFGDGRICDAKTIMLLQYAALHLFGSDSGAP